MQFHGFVALLVSHSSCLIPQPVSKAPKSAVCPFRSSILFGCFEEGKEESKRREEKGRARWRHRGKKDIRLKVLNAFHLLTIEIISFDSILCNL